MKIEKTEEDKYYWKTVFKFRKSLNDFMIERKSSKNPENNHEVWMSAETAEQFIKFVESNRIRKGDETKKEGT